MRAAEFLVTSPDEARRALREVLRGSVSRLVLRVKARDAASAAEIVREVLNDGIIPYTVIVEVVE